MGLGDGRHLGRERAPTLRAEGTKGSRHQHAGTTPGGHLCTWFSGPFSTPRSGSWRATNEQAAASDPPAKADDASRSATTRHRNSGCAEVSLVKLRQNNGEYPPASGTRELFSTKACTQLCDRSSVQWHCAACVIDRCGQQPARVGLRGFESELHIRDHRSRLSESDGYDWSERIRGRSNPDSARGAADLILNPEPRSLPVVMGEGIALRTLVHLRAPNCTVQ